MSWAYSMLVTMVCFVSGNGHLLQTKKFLGQDPVTRAEALPLSIACKAYVYFGTSLDQLRDSGRQRAGLTARPSSTFGRRLLRESHNSFNLGGVIAVGVTIPVAVGLILAVAVLWYKRTSGLPKSPVTHFAQDGTSTTQNRHITGPPKAWIKTFRSWIDSCRGSFSAAKSNPKPKDPSTPKSDSKIGLRAWMTLCLWGQGAAPPKPKIYLSSACEMEFSRLQAATDNFSKANLLGEGGSARVYRAKLDSGDYAAVKMITASGRNASAEFQSEVDLMRQVRHPNLVSLLGYCHQGEHRLLVYELMRNGSLEEQLYGSKQGAGLSWFRRIKIALDSARGLEYLHEKCVPSVVHRDFKASNILLDQNLNAKISDFGLATPLKGLTQEESLQLVGTIGYVAPEFFSSGTLTEKSDVYAFGVTLLELITGRKPIDPSLPPKEQSLVNWAAPQLTNRSKVHKLVALHVREDLNLKHLYQDYMNPGSISVKFIDRGLYIHNVAAVAALCVQKEPSYRPLIADVVQSLLPLVPVDMGGALRRDASYRSSTESSQSSSLRHPQQENLKGHPESFSFAREVGNDFDLPPDISSAANSVEIHTASFSVGIHQYAPRAWD